MTNPPLLNTQGYSNREEWANAITHGIGIIAAIVGMVLLFIKSEGALDWLSGAMYTSSLLLMFIASTLYHAVRHPKVKGWLKRLDHSAIYLLIAGTYTPYLLVSIGGWQGWLFGSLIWAMAVGGVLFKCLVKGKHPRISLFTYLALGWAAVLIIYPLYVNVPGVGLWLLLAGGLCFSVGVLFYVAKRIPYTHSIWHLFVVAGCCCHYLSIYYYVI